MKKRKSWQEKLLDNKGLPRLIEFGKTPKNWPAGLYVIPAPVEVDKIMKQVPKGKLITINQIREILANKHKADYACPITTGIFAWVAAYAAEEQAAEGKKDITPYWRTLKSDGILNEKYPGGIEAQKKLLEKEGHKVVRKGKSKNFTVADFEKSLINIIHIML
jgi:hypothetical protein